MSKARALLYQAYYAAEMMPGLRPWLLKLRNALRAARGRERLSGLIPRGGIPSLSAIKAALRAQEIRSGVEAHRATGSPLPRVTKQDIGILIGLVYRQTDTAVVELCAELLCSVDERLTALYRHLTPREKRILLLAREVAIDADSCGWRSNQDRSRKCDEVVATAVADNRRSNQEDANMTPRADHPIFERFSRSPATETSDTYINFVGARSRRAWEFPVDERMFSSGRSRLLGEDPSLPSRFSEDYYEWIDLLTAVVEAGERMIIVELGAGYGRWTVNGALACAAVRGRPAPTPYLIAVESDARRMDWMRDHFSMNGIDPARHRLVQAAVAGGAGTSMFQQADVRNFGNALVDVPPEDVRWLEATGARRFALRDGSDLGFVQTLPLADILSLSDEVVDFLDMDIQGAEADAVERGIEAMNARVRRAHIGTHGREIEDRVHDCLINHGWIITRFWRRQTVNDAEYGAFKFDDGIIAAINPRLWKPARAAGA